MWSFVTPPGPRDNAAGKPISARQLVFVYIGLAIFIALPVTYLLARDQIREVTNHEFVQTRDRWIAETEDFVMVTKAWTGRARVSLGFDSCEDEVSVRVGFDRGGDPVMADSGLRSEGEWLIVDEETVRRLESATCVRDSLGVPT